MDGKLPAAYKELQLKRVIIRTCWLFPGHREMHLPGSIIANRFLC